MLRVRQSTVPVPGFGRDIQQFEGAFIAVTKRIETVCGYHEGWMLGINTRMKEMLQAIQRGNNPLAVPIIHLLRQVYAEQMKKLQHDLKDIGHPATYHERLPAILEGIAAHPGTV